ncbi:unnamed protein product [Caenorhabditis nigoni]
MSPLACSSETAITEEVVPHTFDPSEAFFFQLRENEASRYSTSSSSLKLLMRFEIEDRFALPFEQPIKPRGSSSSHVAPNLKNSIMFDPQERFVLPVGSYVFHPMESRRGEEKRGEGEERSCSFES